MVFNPVLSLVLFHAFASAFTFYAYVADKSAARKSERRTPEKTLYLFALMGGWPGALLGQKLLRHKTRKQPFQMIFWLTVLLHCGALFWLLWAYSA